jgi:hypothetical protein
LHSQFGKKVPIYIEKVIKKLKKYFHFFSSKIWKKGFKVFIFAAAFGGMGKQGIVRD